MRGIGFAGFEAHLDAVQAVLLDRFTDEFDARQAQQVELRLKMPGWTTGIDDGADNHIAGSTGEAIEIADLHVFDSQGFLSADIATSHFSDWEAEMMRIAAMAAPKPLSILTTVTPEAQEFSIAKSAATPPNEAP